MKSLFVVIVDNGPQDLLENLIVQIQRRLLHHKMQFHLLPQVGILKLLSCFHDFLGFSKSTSVSAMVSARYVMYLLYGHIISVNPFFRENRTKTVKKFCKR